MFPIKLFLSVEKTTFIIAADENVIQYAIKKKYPPMDGFRIELDKEYIEKLIQLPVTVPNLSAKDIQNYLTILVYQKYLSSEHFEKFVEKVHEEKLLISEDVIPQMAYNEIIKLESLSILNAQEFRSLMAVVVNIRGIVSTTLRGNPRQAKRFLNTYIMKKRLAEIYYPDDIDPQILAKLLVLYKLDSTLFNELNEWNKEYDTENKKYRDMRTGTDSQDQAQAYRKWYVPPIIRWVKCQLVELEHIPLNKYFYLTREILNTNIDMESSLSEAARKLLDKLGRSTQGTIPKIVNDIKRLSLQT